jgi:hypothetical protein
VKLTPLKRTTELRRDTEKARAFAGRRSELATDPDKAQAFRDRGRVSSARSLERSARRNGKRPGAGFTPASPAQRAKAAAERFCWGCGRERSDWLVLDPAHFCSRAKGGCDHADCVVVLCRAGDGSGCHRSWDDGDLDLLRVCSRDYERRWAAECSHAATHLTPVQVVERLAGARTQWSDAA